MKTNEALKLIGEKAFLDKIYRYAYRRCNTSYEAEDLCSDIVLAVLSSVRNQKQIENFYAFVWTIARRVYADHAEMGSQTRRRSVSECRECPSESEIDRFIEETADRETLGRIFREISFLSKMYRDVMVLYYLDELKTKEIAKKLGISETTVKQRLFSARSTVRKEVENMEERKLSLKPITMDFFGSGSVTGNTPFTNAQRTFSQNLIYACKNVAKNAKMLSEELCVPCLYVEEELEIQLHGQNGTYGTLRKQGDKYISNIIILDEKERVKGAKLYEKYTERFCTILSEYLSENADAFLKFPFISRPGGMEKILWVLICNAAWGFVRETEKVMDEIGFSDVEEAIATSGRKFTAGIVVRDSGESPSMYGYGCDGNNAKNYCGYSFVEFSNIYGPKIEARYRCGYNLSHDEVIALLLKSIGGIALEKLSESEREVAAKGIEAGLLCKNGSLLEPNVLIVEAEKTNELHRLLDGFYIRLESCCRELAEEAATFIRKHIQKHLINEYKTYNMILSSSFSGQVIDKCIEIGLLNEPKSRKGPEGVLVRVKK